MNEMPCVDSVTHSNTYKKLDRRESVTDTQQM